VVRVCEIDWPGQILKGHEAGPPSTRTTPIVAIAASHRRGGAGLLLLILTPYRSFGPSLTGTLREKQGALQYIENL
jgi:hypothetical protein